VPAGRVQGIDDIAENRFTWDRKMLMELQHPECGPVKVLGSPFKSSRSPGIVATAAPTIGQHSREILGEVLGYSSEKIDELAAARVIGLPAAGSAS
jgi:crotonobetainyl-CoA:carnitine CoA-transferase CaiB-like acyl-CoA transferase